MPFIALLIAAVMLSAPPLPQAVDELERGKRLAENGDIASARESFENAAKISPGYAAPLNELGILLVGEDKLPEAVEQFKKAIAADKTFALAHNNLGFTLRKLARYAEAVEAYKAYVALERADPAGFFGLGDASKNAGDKAGALAAYEKCVSLAKASKGEKNEKLAAKAQAALAPLQGELGRTPAAATPEAQPAAVQTPKPAVEASARPAPAPVAEGSAVKPAAAPAPAQTVAVAPEKAGLAEKRIEEGIKARSAGRLRDALFALQDAANADPSNVRAVFELGVTYAMLNYYPQAIERWQRVLTMSGDEPTRTAAQQNIDKARQKMSSAPAPQGAATHPAATPVEVQAYNLGVQLYGQQKYAEALKELDRAIAARAEFPQAFTARGSAHFALRDYVHALNDYGQAMRLDRVMASPLFGVAESYFAMGRKVDALPYYQAYAVSKAADVQPSLQEIARQRIADIGK